MTTRIVHIIPSLDQGGAEKQLVLLATGLPRDQFDVHVCTLTRGGPRQAALEEAGIPVHAIDKSWKIDPLAFFRLRSLLRQLQPQLVHTWIFAANSYGRQAALSAGVPRLVAGERCVDQWKVWHELAIDRHLARRTDRIVTNSQGVVDFYVGHGISREKFVVIPNGIESDCPESKLDRRQMLDMCRLPADTKVIGAIGRLWPQKRFKDLIWAAELLKVIRDDVHLLIIGEGPQREILYRWRDHLRIADRVHFLGHRDDVPDLLPHFDFFWMASAYEGQSNAMMEAMRAGVPVIATDIPGNRDLIQDGVTGCLVPLGDRAAFARVTKLLLENPEKRQPLIDTARRRIGSEFTIEQMVERHRRLYQQLLAD